MNTKPTLSVITITFEDSLGLKRTMESLQLLQNSGLSWEHIIVDSSPEVNTEVIRAFRDWLLTRIETPPRGIYPAFNLGIEHATGEYLWFLNSGDRLLSVENLKNLIVQFSKDPSIDLVGAPVEIYRENKFTYFSKAKAPLISNILGQNGLCHQGIIYRRGVFARVGAFDESFKLAGDYDHHFKCYFKNVRFGTYSQAIAQYDRDGRSDNYQAVFKEYVKIWRDVRPRLDRQMRYLNDFLAMAHFLKIRAIKSKLLKPISKPLKKIWYKLH